MPEKRKGIRETDDDARRLARILLRSARFASLATLDPESGHPSVSRILLGIDTDGVPMSLISGLSAHSKAIAADSRVSILVGEPGKGDPLAHPRLSIRCTAERVERDDTRRPHLRARFLRRHAKAALYADFADFAFVRMAPISATLNGGFGKAYELPGCDLRIQSPASDEIARHELELIESVNRDHLAAIAALARNYGGRNRGRWRVCGLDAAGFDLQCGAELKRIEFDEIVRQAKYLHLGLGDMLTQAR